MFLNLSGLQYVPRRLDPNIPNKRTLLGTLAFHINAILVETHDLKTMAISADPLRLQGERVREGTSAHGVEGSSMVLLCGGARSGPGDGAPDSGIEAFLSRSDSGRKGSLKSLKPLKPLETCHWFCHTGRLLGAVEGGTSMVLRG